jgi:hypothetical protein
MVTITEPASKTAPKTNAAAKPMKGAGEGIEGQDVAAGDSSQFALSFDWSVTLRNAMTGNCAPPLL